MCVFVTHRPLRSSLRSRVVPVWRLYFLQRDARACDGMGVRVMFDCLKGVARYDEGWGTYSKIRTSIMFSIQHMMTTRIQSTMEICQA